MRFIPDLQKAVIVAKAILVPAVMGVAVIVEDGQGRILLVRHSYAPGWGIPGGGVDRGEPPERTVTREMREEVNFQGSETPTFLSLHVRKVLWFTNFVAVYHLRGEIDFKPNLEIVAAAFFPPDALPADTTPASRKRIAEFLGLEARNLYW